MTRPRIPSRAIWDPGKVDDGSRTMVNLDTGEIIEVPPSKTRALRLAERAARHEVKVAAQRAEQAERNEQWIREIRAGFPKRTPIGLERPAGYQPEAASAAMNRTGEA